MKKLLAMLLATMVLVCGLGMTVMAGTFDVESSDDLYNDVEFPSWGDLYGKFVVGNAAAEAGETFTVPVSIENNPGIISLKLAVSYDANLLELVSATVGDFGSTEAEGEGEAATLTFGPVESVPFVINWVDALAPVNNETNGVVANLTFRVKDDVEDGTTAISVSYDAGDVFDYDLNNIEFTTTEGTITLTAAPAYIPGDVNDDGRVTIRDLTLLQQYINKWDVPVNVDAADTNGDGRVTIRDLTLLQQYINKWDVTLG